METEKKVCQLLRDRFDRKKIFKWGLIGAILGVCWTVIWGFVLPVVRETWVAELYWKVHAIPYGFLDRFVIGEGGLIGKHNAIGILAIDVICFGMIGFLLAIISYLLSLPLKRFLKKCS